MLASTAPLLLLLIALSFEEEDDDGAIPRAASVTALRFSISSLAIGGRCSFTGLARNVRVARFAVVVFIIVMLVICASSKGWSDTNLESATRRVETARDLSFNMLR